jgi:hypothetical protein
MHKSDCAQTVVASVLLYICLDVINYIFSKNLIHILNLSINEVGTLKKKQETRRQHLIYRRKLLKMVCQVHFLNKIVH